MPPWCDLTLYDVAARNVMSGGVHYRDVFDTNPPGFVWSLVAVRTLFGSSVEAVRAVDLAVVAATVALLGRWVRRAGGNPAAVAWMAAGAALFYPFSSEFNHCQRDVWMTLPVVGVGLLRLRRTANGGDDWQFVGGAFVEGFVLGLGAWLKPHALIPAAAVWLVTLPRLAGRWPRPWRAAALDFLGNFAGGLTVLALGVAWLIGTGAWASFIEVFTFWNPGYLNMVLRELPIRWPDQFFYFPPWSWFQPAALLLALVVLAWEAWRTFRSRMTDEGFARTALAALFLAWTAQGLFLQRGFPYVHVPETLLMLAVFASTGYPAAIAGVVAVAAIAVVTMDRHPLTDAKRWSPWPACWRFDLTPTEYRERRNAVGFDVNCFGGIDWVQLGEVADFLASQQPPLRDGELIAWHDSPHALYLLTGVRPGFRFMHVSTICGIGPDQYERLRQELHVAAPHARFVVADLERVFDTRVPGEREAMSEPGPDAADVLPPAMRAWFPRVSASFPFDQTAVFRSANGRGRYIVLRLDRPLQHDCRIPVGLGEDLGDDR